MKHILASTGILLLIILLTVNCPETPPDPVDPFYYNHSWVLDTVNMVGSVQATVHNELNFTNDGLGTWREKYTPGEDATGEITASHFDPTTQEFRYTLDEVTLFDYAPIAYSEDSMYLPGYYQKDAGGNLEGVWTNTFTISYIYNDEETPHQITESSIEFKSDNTYIIKVDVTAYTFDGEVDPIGSSSEQQTGEYEFDGTILKMNNSTITTFAEIDYILDGEYFGFGVPYVRSD